MPFADRELMAELYRAGGAAGKARRLIGACLRRARSLSAARRADVVVVHRAACLAGPAVLERVLAAFGPPLVYDFDDAIFLLHATEANRRFAWLKAPGKTKAICRVSRHVVAANQELANWARSLNPNVTVVPSSVDVERFRPAAGARYGRLVIGWTGSSTSQTHLEQFAPVLKAVLAHLPAELHVHSDRRPELRELPHVWHPWSAENEPEVLARFDVGIMPLPDEPWAWGKSAMKALLYMAMGLPVVASPVGAACEVVSHEENGLLARNAEEWFACLERLASDPALRERMGRAGRALVEARYSAAGSAALFGGVLRQAAAAG
jgi:glycosyltransferase involved in cell wall biosynthesis